MALTAPDGHFLSVNHAFSSLIGYSEDELSDGTFAAITHPDDAALSRQQMQRLVQGEVDAVQFEKRYIHRDGHVVWVQLTSSLVKDEDGQPLYSTTQLMDISARHAAEEALRQSEARFRSCIEAMPVGVVLTSQDGTVLMSNQAASKILGLSVEQLSGTAAPSRGWEVRREDGETASLRDLLGLAAITREGTAGSTVLDLTRSGITDRAWVQRSGSPLCLEDGSISGMISTFTDITALRQAEAGMRASEARLRAQYQDLPEPMYTFQRQDEDFILVDFNRAAERTTQGGVRALLGVPARTMFDHAPDALQYLARCWEERRTVEHQTHYLFQTTGEVRDLVVSHVYVPPDLVLLHTMDVTERKKAETEVIRHLARLSALRAIDMSITGSLDLRLTLGILLEQVTLQLGIDAAGVLILNASSHRLEYTAARGFRDNSRLGTVLRLGEGYAGRAALERRQVKVCDLRSEGVSEEGFVTYFAVPLVAKGEVKGVLELFHRESLDPERHWLEFLEALAGQAAIAIDNGTLFERMQRSNLELSLAYDTTIEGWSRALDLRDRETEGHSQRVTELTLALAQNMRLSEAEMVHVRHGALLHDIGKMGIPDSILLKPGPLSDDEWVVMRKHPTYAYELLSPISYLHLALDIPYCHHEKWDGTGYPRGLCGQVIPLAARIFAVADVWDALRSDRPYRRGWVQERVQQYILSQADLHFDPMVVTAFFELINSGHSSHRVPRRDTLATPTQAVS